MRGYARIAAMTPTKRLADVYWRKEHYYKTGDISREPCIDKSTFIGSPERLVLEQASDLGYQTGGADAAGCLAWVMAAMGAYSFALHFMHAPGAVKFFSYVYMFFSFPSVKFCILSIQLFSSIYV